MGFPDEYVKWVEGLHHGAATRICNDGWLGDEVPVQSGVRQGCPLAPYLFLCAVEPLCQEAQRRQLGMDIGGAGKLTYLGYADDTTFLLKGRAQLDAAGELLRDFEQMSRLAANCDKTVVMPLGKQRDEQPPAASPFKWAARDEPERLLGVWITSSGDAKPSWRKALRRMETELKKWEEKYLTTTARVAVINAYVMPIALFQAQVASAGPGFILWSAELMQMRRSDGGLGVINIRNRLDAKALHSAGGLLTEESSLRRSLAEMAARLPLGYASFYAHEALLKAWGGGSERWKAIAAVVMSSPIAQDLPSNTRWDVEKERVVFNWHILRGKSCPFGRRKEDECLRDITVGDLVMKWVDGTRSPKSPEQLARLLGSKEAAALAATVF
ncbi:unnamed protein product [Closterium sp. Yama58-4]|nr:unnamed protein product [Closterium sp. Yama58-4]